AMAVVATFAKSRRLKLQLDRSMFFIIMSILHVWREKCDDSSGSVENRKEYPVRRELRWREFHYITSAKFCPGELSW
ncbi:MAG: hypothetical protein P1V19_16340, partial [Gimesia sp.]|nr:hypothetical protein [Gimesia sp.]